MDLSRVAYRPRACEVALETEEPVIGLTAGVLDVHPTAGFSPAHEEQLNCEEGLEGQW